MQGPGQDLIREYLPGRRNWASASPLGFCLRHFKGTNADSHAGSTMMTDQLTSQGPAERVEAEVPRPLHMAGPLAELASEPSL